MIRPLPFFAIAGMLLCLCLALANAAPRADLFAALAPGRGLALDELAVGDVAALKMRHVRERPAYDVMLLGNSRPLPLGAEDLGLGPGHVFNLSLTGESFRSSVMALERVAEAGRLPRLAVIAIDHLELNYYNNPQWPPLVERWRQAARDVAAGLARPGIPLADAARMALRHAITETAVVRDSLNFDRLVRGAGTVLSDLSGGATGLDIAADGRAAYLADGSRKAPSPPRDHVDEPLPPPNRNLLPGYLDYDLARLKTVAALGLRVVIFETPLFPDTHRRAMAAPSAVAAQSRAALIDLCRRYGFECHVAPAAVDDLARNGWRDVGHPPAAALGAYLKSVLGTGGMAGAR